MRILIVEDDEALCRAAMLVMATSSHETRCVGTMAMCPPAIADFDPEAVILDLGLPDSSGVETFEAMLGLTEAPIIIFSAEPMWKKECIRLGAREFLTKGDFTPMDIPSAITRAFGRDRLVKVLDHQDLVANGEVTSPGRAIEDAGKIGDGLLSLAHEMRTYATG